ncbi:DNA adenine methylase [Rhodopirellula sallentina]|uniref:D12 class N6 adenine-specific DNA methyltransferase n=1 Tax=Rhodopirellula sallentina SM41 TaxID=1263870 RepID=M5UGT7_9BACT|nr:DNA adenine methylase [Rhodopirellula sallentina]EMI55213.1 D12 class N6 adenine-specific DNA methyltransferase [Rhodopirellula sallentina SM41]
MLTHDLGAATRLTLPLKWHGGKHYLAPKIIDLMPRHLHYVEPFGGGLAVLLNKDPFDPRHQWGKASYEQGVSEVVNDVYGPLQNFWNVLKDSNTFSDFQRVVSATTFSEVEFDASAERLFPAHELDVEAAVAFFVRCRQSRAGSFRSFATLSRNRTRSRMNEQASAWLGAIDGLETVHDRLKRVVILCRNALDVICQQDGERTLFYLDPPYLPSTRASSGNYEHEMTNDQHVLLLETIRACKGNVMLSGYPNDLYNEMLDGWNRHDFEIDNKVSGAQQKRVMVESVWCNF